MRGAELLVAGEAGGDRRGAGRHGNDLELAWDRPFDQWPGWGSDDAPDASLDLDDLLAEVQ